MPRNPFTPSFGVSPPVLVGRESDLRAVHDALESGPGDPFRAVKVHGLRGSGKTVFLNAVEDAARERGWTVLSETARPGMLTRLTQVELPRILAPLDPDAIERTATASGAELLGASVSTEYEVNRRYQAHDDFRSMLTALADLKARDGAGVLITVDEMNPSAEIDLRELTHTIQHCFREGREVAFAGAGLYADFHALLDLPGMTFLRRAEEIDFGRVSDDDARRGLLDPIQTWGGRIEAAALDLAVRGTQGYPFMIQAVGHRMWQQAPDHAIDRDCAIEATDYALRRVGQLVLAPELRPLSAVDRTYLSAMAHDSGASRTGTIAERLGVSAAYGSVYRQRLIEAGLIHEAGHGYVDFSMPTMRDYLRAHAAADVVQTVSDEQAGAEHQVRPAPERGQLDEHRRPPGTDDGPSA